MFNPFLSLYWLRRNARVMGGVIKIAALLGFAVIVMGSTGMAAGAEEPVCPVTFARLASAPLSAPANEADRPAWAARLPEEVRAIDGRRIEITGYMLPLKMQSGRVTDFLLMRDQTACCYGKMPAANEYVVAQATAGGLAVRMDIPVTVRGTLRVAPEGIEGAVYQFYALENVSAVLAR